MTERVMLVDFENVQSVELARLPADVRVLLVLGAKQSKLPTELVLEASRMGDRFSYSNCELLLDRGGLYTHFLI